VTAPFIRSAGGKRELCPQILPLMPDPDAFDTYVEPFAGGAAVFYALWGEGRLDNKTVVLGDGDSDLITLYEAVRDDVIGLVREAGRLVQAAQKAKNAQKYYEEQRALWNKGGRYRTPGRHLFLRQACFNGLWRTNKDGGMNTPWRGEAPAPVDEAKLLRAMTALQGVELLDWDFRRYEASDDFYVGEKTLVYLDPPYLGDKDDFTSYLPSGWSEADLRALIELCVEWSKRGAYVVLSHSKSEVLDKLLDELWGIRCTVHEVEARRSINSDGNGRGPVPEVVVIGKPSVDTGHVTRHDGLNHGEVARAE